MLSPIFQKDLKRLDLLKMPLSPVERQVKIAVYRNHSFEMVAGVLNVFLNCSGMAANFTFSDYDDSLNFTPVEADINLIWIDAKRYKISNLNDFLNERAAVLRAGAKSPILIAYTGEKQNLSPKVPDTYFWCVEDDLADLEGPAFDEAKEAYSGTRLSSKAMLECARVLGMRYIPALLYPPLKAIVCDLDNTLYQGVLGEDGMDGLIANNDLQRQIKTLKEQGFFLCIASKNEEADVRRLFEKRTDFVLRWEDFTAVAINWDAKADNILNLAETLNIGTDAMLFIDDNPAELQNVEATGVQKLLADKDVCQVLKYCPRLLKLRKSTEDGLRSKDVQANIQRAKLAAAMSPREYFEKLKIKLIYNIDNTNQIPRVSELLNKTNQFILSYKRYKEADVEKFMADSDKCLITVQMSDNLSDSGVIAILAAHAENNILIADELTVSCRALGRNLENVMLPEMFRLAGETLGAGETMEIPYKKGERNGPALTWLKSLVNTDLEDVGTALFSIPDKIDLSGLTVEVKK